MKLKTDFYITWKNKQYGFHAEAPLKTDITLEDIEIDMHLDEFTKIKILMIAHEELMKKLEEVRK